VIGDDIGHLSFEEAFADLQRTIEEMRGEALTLDRALALYERGTALAERCNTLLTAAELRVSESTPQASGVRSVREGFLSEEW
jgi:exodeoxyribonuclease VII small subunit